MHFSTIPTVLFSLSTIISLSSSLAVVPTSPQCAELCGNVLDGTSGTEITCTDAGYASSAYGATFKSCIACELNSTYFDPVTRIPDLQYALYNMRFALSWCLFGWQNNTALDNNPCLTKFSCGPLEDAFEFDALRVNSSAYDYCPLIRSNEISVPKCSSCLAEMGNENFLSNFVTVLDGACQQTPVLGSTVSLQGSIFSSQTVNITTPSHTPTSSHHTSNSSLSLGAKVGIAVGAIVAFLVISGCCIVCFGRRRRRRVLAAKARESGYEWQPRGSAMQEQHSTSAGPYFGAPQPAFSPNPNSAGPFFDSPQSQRPLFTNAWGQVVNTDESPISASTYYGPEHSQNLGSAGGFGGGDIQKAYFSPYTSTYTSPVSATDLPRKIDMAWPIEKKAMVEPEDERSERIEMVAQGQNDYHNDRKELGQFRVAPMTGYGDGDGAKGKVWQGPDAPILSHPGHGRGQAVQKGKSSDLVLRQDETEYDEGRTAGHQRSRSILLTESDAERGQAI